MRSRLVEHDRLVEMRSSISDVPGMEERQTHLAMPVHERRGRALLLSQRQKLDGEFLRHVAIEGDKVRNPKAIKDREQQQRVFGRLSKRVRLFNQRRARSTAALVSGAA